MAQNRSPAFFTVAALLLLATAAPLALAQVQPAQLLPPVQLPIGQLINAIQINGALCCTPTRNCPGGPGIAKVNYTMSCRFGTLMSGSCSVVVAQGATGINNAGFTINLTNIIPTLLSTLGMTVADLLAGKIPCQIIIDLLIDQALCPTLNGALVGVLTLVGTTVSTVLGIVLNLGVTFSLGP